MFFRAVAVTLTLLAPAPAAAAAQSAPGSWTPGWFVELESPPSADGTDPAALSAERTRFRNAARASGITYRQRFAYSTLFNGVSVSADDDAVAELRHLDGVAAVHPVTTATLEQTASAFEPSIEFASTMTGVDVARSRLGFTGRGIHVAVMDSGIDYDHPDLGGCFGPGCRVSTGYDFVGDDYDEEEGDAAWQPVPHPDADPDDDCNGHGTHVAGIVGARGAVTGVAPDVTLGAYRVFGCHGATSTDVMLAAMERIYRDGADVLNMSITEVRSSWPESPTAKAATRLVDKGVVVVAGAGNNRSDGLWGGGAPGVGEGVIAAASVDNRKLSLPAFSLSPDDLTVPYLPAAGTVSIPLSGSSELARTGTVATEDDACAPLLGGSLEGKVVLVRRGTCPFTAKGANVAAAGAVGMVLFNNDVDDNGWLPWVGGVPIPVVYVSRTQGALVNDRLDQGPVRLTWGAIAAEPVATAGLLSSFSATGLAADLSLKPDIAAPGALIRSTAPIELGSYLNGSGTSMSSPHVAGAAALFLQAHPRVRARDVATWLLNSADPVPAAGASGAIDPVARQGAGLLDIDDAILATTAIAPAKLSLGDDEPAPRTLTLANTAPRTVTYSLSHAPALAVAGRDPATEHVEGAPAAVAFSQDGRPVSSVTVRPFGRARLDVRVTPSPALSEGALYGGYLVFMPTAGDQPLRVPYAGYKGDYQAVPATTPTAQGFPWLARATQLTVSGGGLQPLYVKQAAGATFTLRPTTLSLGPFSRASVDRPVVLVHFNHPARRVRVEVFRARHEVRLGEALVQDHVARDIVENPAASPASLATALPLDGTTRLGRRRLRLPDGDYYVVMTVERALAERGTPKETWTSPVFRIDRP